MNNIKLKSIIKIIVMKKSNNLFPLAAIVLMLFIAGGASTKKSKTSVPNYIGQWNWSMDLPDQTINGYLKFSQEDDGVIGVIGGDQGEQQLTDFVIDEEKVSGNFDYMGYSVDMNGTFEGNVLNGTMSAEGYEFPFEANKQQ